MNKYAAYPPCKEYKDNGVAVRQPAIGYYPTYNDAYEALLEYTKNPYDIGNRKLTFKEVYELWEKEREQTKNESSQTKKSYNQGYALCKQVHDDIYAELKDSDFQNLIDSCEKSNSTKKNIIKTVHGMGKFALRKDIVVKDYASFARLNKTEDDETGEPFSPEQIKILWEHCENEVVQTILFMCYTGHRINEYKVATIDLEERTITGGLKNKRSKERVVPIPDLVFDYAKKIDFKRWNGRKFREEKFYPILKRLKIDENNGKKLVPHSCRHTFSWLCDHYKVEKGCKAFMMGHSLGASVEENVYGHRTIEELREEIKKLGKLDEMNLS